MYRICLILSLTLITYNCFSQDIVNDVIGVSGNKISNNNITINDTSGELVSTTISNNQITLTQGFQQTSRLLHVSPKVILQGAATNSGGNLMRDDLRLGEYIPEIAPYNNNKISSSENVYNTTGSNAIIDWVTVELRNSNFRVVSEKSALLQKDGDIVSADGVSPLQFTANNNEYYIEINHRNHLGAMTKNKISLSSSPISIDFTDGSTPLYGNFAQTEISSSTFALWAGNANSDDRVRYQGSNNDTDYIKDKIRSNPNNPSNSNLFLYNGYDNADVNMDGIIRYQGSNNDSDVIKDIIRSHPNNPSLSNLFLFLQQTPN